jgi:hypothetical protein
MSYVTILCLPYNLHIEVIQIFFSGFQENGQAYLAGSGGVRA